jgi:hypothetical protein
MMNDSSSLVLTKQHVHWFEKPKVLLTLKNENCQACQSRKQSRLAKYTVPLLSSSIIYASK